MNLPAGIYKPIRLVGLTGSIGTGKTTAADAFRKLGVPVVDADEIARAVVEPGSPALDEIRAAFGPDLLNQEGGLDRAALSALVFGQPEKLHRLEEILHPLIAVEAKARFSLAREKNPEGYVVYDVPLLFEKGMEEGFDLVVTVFAPPEEQKKRVMARSALGLEEIERRMAAQMSASKKAARSHVVLDNTGAPAELADQVAALAGAIDRHNKENRLTKG